VTDLAQLVDLASARLGGAVLWANDEFFAPKENLIQPEKPIFLEDKYTDRGKWMDGWETRRRRTPGNDWCILRLGLPGILRGIVVDTSFFRGNYPEHCRVEACAVKGSPSVEQLESSATKWIEVVPRSPLKGDSQNVFAIASPHRFTHLRFGIYPDGGVARLRAYGEVLPDWREILSASSEVDLAAVEHGGRVVASSDQFFSAPQNLLMPGRSLHMGDGWETRRRRGPGHDWTIIQLGIAGTIRRVEVDTAHFKGNYPESCSLEASSAEGVGVEPTCGPPAACLRRQGRAGTGREIASASVCWNEVLPRTVLAADQQHFFEREIRDLGPVTHARLNIFPDGGVSRLRIYGTPGRAGRMAEGLRWLNALTEEEANARLLDCCGSANWARYMVAQRPYLSPQQLFEAAERVWSGLGGEDWLEAFGRHPRIGERKAAGEQAAGAGQWSEQEQTVVRGAPAQILGALGEANRAYEARFGHIFIVCATGKTAEAMLGLLEQRLKNPPEMELRIAAEEQQKIMRLRLEKLLEL